MSETISESRFHKLLIIINGLVPLALLGWDAAHHQLGANPLEFATHTTGTMTLIFLVLTLSITPLRKLTKWPALIKLRRLLGLFAFFYGTLHLFTYLWFDKFFNFSKVFKDVISRQFIALGMIAFLLLLPLAITSTNGMVKRLGGQRWLKLHRFVYYATIAAMLHYWLSVKVDSDQPTIFAITIGLLLGYRVMSARMRQPAVNSIKISQ